MLGLKPWSFGSKCIAHFLMAVVETPSDNQLCVEG